MSPRKKSKEPEGLRARAARRFAQGLESLGERTLVARRVIAGLVLVGLGVAWALGVGPLESRVAAIQSDPIKVEFRWPTAGSTQTWVPASVRADLSQVVLASVSMDPFDGESLEIARERLIRTGWFTSVNAVRRTPGAIIAIDAHWRTPVAVVSRDGSDYLIGQDTAVMRTPSATGTPAGMFRILSPLADAPRDPDTGTIAYGQPWHFDDVRHAIALLDLVAPSPGSASIIGVDLSRYPKTGRLSLVTDAGCHLVWGAPLGETSPGEVPVERKMAHLKAILDAARRLDRGQKRIEIFTEHVFIDRTPDVGSRG